MMANDGYEKQWNNKFERLKWYKLEYGDCLVVPRHYKDDPSLGVWVKNQGMIFKCGTMDRCRVEQLSSIGFWWEALQSRAAHECSSG
jgi:hypothetical protein